jgi:small subunit ribosomal protein S17
MADEKNLNDETTADEAAEPAEAEETPVEEVVAAAGPEDEVEETADEPAEEPAAEPVPEVVAEDAPAPTADEEPAAEPEPEPVAEAAADEPAAEDAAADEAPTAEAPAAAAPPEAAPAVPAPQSGPKPKRKRLPRSQRPQKTRPQRAKAAERKPIVRLEKPEHDRGRRQERQGTVVSDAMDKTIVVEVDTIKAHVKYKKVVRRSTKFHAHDERNEAKAGDVVRIVETRPLSATKRWRLAEIVEVAK